MKIEVYSLYFYSEPGYGVRAPCKNFCHETLGSQGIELYLRIYLEYCIPIPTASSSDMAITKLDL